MDAVATRRDSAFAGRVMDVLELASLFVYGDRSANVREALALFGAGLMTPVGGCARVLPRSHPPLP